MSETKISWTDQVWNPVTGCDAVSLGCDNCYAKKMAKRLKAMGLDKYRNEFEVTCHPNELDKPSRWKKPRRIFVNSMSDLFHREVPDSFIHDVFCVIDENKQHTFQVLTKRPERISKAYEDMWLDSWGQDNIWLGVTAENQKYADKRIPQLLQIPAAKRFVSCEPLLGEINLSSYFEGVDIIPDHTPGCDPNDGCTSDCPIPVQIEVPKLDWVIIGCESGSNRRPCNLDWVYSLVDQCQNASVPVFVKQYEENGKIVKKIEDFRHDLQIQEFPV